MATIKKMVMLQTGCPVPATPSGRTRSVTCTTTLPFLFSAHFHVSYSRPLIAFLSASALMFFSVLLPFLYSALFPSSDTARSSCLAAREDEEVPRAGSHKRRDVPCGGRHMQGRNMPPTLCVTIARAAPTRSSVLHRPAPRCRRAPRHH